MAGVLAAWSALLGGVPLMLGTGTGSKIRQPLGYSIVGGLLLSQLLTLFTTPVVYLYLDRLAGWLRHVRSRSAAFKLKRCRLERPIVIFRVFQLGCDLPITPSPQSYQIVSRDILVRLRFQRRKGSMPDSPAGRRRWPRDCVPSPRRTATGEAPGLP
jgi:hypothetical protein